MEHTMKLLKQWGIYLSVFYVILLYITLLFPLDVPWSKRSYDRERFRQKYLQVNKFRPQFEPDTSKTSNITPITSSWVGGRLRGLTGSALGHRSLPPEFESHRCHI